jgi:cell division septum initiation protein DivIVA
MSDFDRPGTTLQESVQRRPGRSRISNFGDRLARTFAPYDRAPDGTQDWVLPGEPGYGDDEELPQPWEAIDARYPIVRHGYDRAAVDDHVAELEHEISELQARAASGPTVSEEIERLGEQTSAILTVAHDKAHEMRRRAQEEADRCVADAASNAVKITEDAKRQLRQIECDTDAVWRDRSRLLDDVRAVATALFSLTEDAVERFPAEPESSEKAALDGRVRSMAMPAPSAPRPEAWAEHVASVEPSMQETPSEDRPSDDHHGERE